MCELNNCNCCEGLSVETPVEIINRPGLGVISYRVGIYDQFKQSSLARLSLSGQPALKGLTTREDTDFSIALLDACAVVSDVLSFYQERIANESYMRTATERFSVLEMARLIGYELRPGVAAGAYLAFTIEDAPAPLGPLTGTNNSSNIKEGLPPIRIQKGTKVQSVPGPDEKPQLFETIEDIETRAEWNMIRPRMSQFLDNPANNLIIFNGTANNLKQGDILLVITQGSFIYRKIVKVIVDNDAKTTWVYFVADAGLPSYTRPVALPQGDINNFKEATELTQAIVTSIVNSVWKEEDLAMLIETKNWSAHELISGMNKLIAAQSAITTIYVFRKHVFAFGNNAPKRITLTNGNPATYTEWIEEESQGQIFLDAAYEEIMPGSYLAVQRSGVANPETYTIDSVNICSRAVYGMSGKTTVINFTASASLPNPWWGGTEGGYIDNLRSLSIYAQPELLQQVEYPITDVVTGDTITLNRYYPGLKKGQAVILTGDRSDLKGVTASELKILAEVIVEKGFTVLRFDGALHHGALQYSYIRNSVMICANVAYATNGETVEEVLGSGDGSSTFQEFTLRQPPLTYIGASNSSGSQSTLEIRVNNLLWHEVDNFLEHEPGERIYITRRNNDGKTTVTFGDGITGARLPSGQENIKAKYRKGIGLGGQVKANQLSQLMTRPLGVKAAVNPIAASGAADPEYIEDAKRNAPLAILTLGRIVSLQDYEDFARSFSGIDKALATWTWVGQKRHIFITVAGSNGAVVEKDSDLYSDLLDAIRKAGDTKVVVSIESYMPQFFRLKASVQTDPDYLTEKVLKEIDEKLRKNFSFSSRQFGQLVSYSEVVSVIQSIDGVIAIDIDKLYRSGDAEDLNYNISAAIPGIQNQNVLAAELLMLDPRPLDLKTMI